MWAGSHRRMWDRLAWCQWQVQSGVRTMSCVTHAASRVQVDSARKLRWFDQDDLSQLVEVTTREKQALQGTIAALRQVSLLLLLLCSPGGRLTDVQRGRTRLCHVQ